MSTRGRERTANRTLYASVGEKEPHYPMVVLINGGSASASETKRQRETRPITPGAQCGDSTSRTRSEPALPSLNSLSALARSVWGTLDAHTTAVIPDSGGLPSLGHDALIATRSPLANRTDTSDRAPNWPSTGSEVVVTSKREPDWA